MIHDLKEARNAHNFCCTPPTCKQLNPDPSSSPSLSEACLIYKPESKPTLGHPSVMKLLSMSLAIFCDTALATTTDTAPGGLKKDGESASLHRSLSSDDSEANVTAKHMCKIFETFDNMGREENNDISIPGLSWSPLRDDFDPRDDFLCPTEDVVAAICSAQKLYENPAVQKSWCYTLLK
jgi:hypothetical protein